jgi:hypothetical protein
MGLILSQFHVKHDEFFKTAAPRTGNPEVASHWQGVSGINAIKGKHPDHDAMLNPIPDGKSLGNVPEPVERTE